MSDLLAALEALPDPAWCEGRVAQAIVVDGAPTDDDAWWIAHSEPAPFGDEAGTRFDANVRDTRRLKARGATPVRFDPRPILDEIQGALATDCRLAAELVDVLVYTRGSRFLPHQDTPRHDDQLGTLVVEIPHAHHGGVLTLRDGEREAAIDWSQPAEGVRWVAMFGDVTHAIAPVTDGMRVTAVYTLRYRFGERLEPMDRERFDVLVDAAIARHDEAWDESLIAIPCTRMIVAPRDVTIPLTRASLRGSDRLVAAAFERARIEVTVRACLAVGSAGAPLLDVVRDAKSYRRLLVLRRPIPEPLFEASEGIAWGPISSNIHGYAIAALDSYIETVEWPYGTEWLVRTGAHVHAKEMLFSGTNYFGNEYSAYYTYRFAVMLAHVPTNEALFG